MVTVHRAARRRLHVSRVVPAPAEFVWELLISVRCWPDWGPSIRRVEFDDERISLGSRGVVETVGGVNLPFEITEFSNERSWSWRVAGLDATDHAVEPDADGTRVSFGVPWFAAPYLAVCRVALGRIDRLVQDTR